VARLSRQLRTTATTATTGAAAAVLTRQRARVFAAFSSTVLPSVEEDDDAFAPPAAARRLRRATAASSCHYYRQRFAAGGGAAASFSSSPAAGSGTSTSSAVGNGGGSSSGRYAAVDHSVAYEESMNGRHGRQLALAALEGIGKDDPPFDPFLEEELEEERLRQAASLDDGEILGEEEYVEDEGGSVVAEAEEEGGFEEEEDDGDDLYEEEGEDEEMTSFRSVYNNDGSLRRSKSELATFRAGAPAGGVFAVIELAGSQHKVTTDDALIVNRLKPLDTYAIGSVHTLKDDAVLLVGSTYLTLVGMPYVAGAEVDVMVEEITKDAKVVVFKRRRRKNSRSKNGFRRDVTVLRILDIRPPSPYANHRRVERKPPADVAVDNDQYDRLIVA